MHPTGTPRKTAQERGRDVRDAREFLRIPVVIPVRVEMLSAAGADSPAVVPGTLLNIGRGGGRVRARGEFPPGSRLSICVPAGSPTLRLLAEVVWASRPSDGGSQPAAYGIRWAEPLPSGVLETVLVLHGLGCK